MSTPHRRLAAVVVGLALISPAVTGCIPSVDELIGGVVQQGIEAGIENATGVDTAVGSLPSGFPSEVPVAEGEIVAGAAVKNDDGSTGWAVSITTDRTAEEIAAQLAGAGFSPPADAGEFSIPGIVLVENAKYTVSVVVGQDGDTGNAYYVVVPKS